jgi:hypothetical protein
MSAASIAQPSFMARTKATLSTNGLTVASAIGLSRAARLDGHEPGRQSDGNRSAGAAGLETRHKFLRVHRSAPVKERYQ